MNTKEEIGRLLKQTRDDKKITLEKVAEKLKIRKKYLLSIEDANYDEIPGSAYIDGYIKQYSSFLGIYDKVCDLRKFKQKTIKRLDKVAEKITPRFTYKFYSIITILFIILVAISFSPTPKEYSNKVEKYLIQDVE